MASLRRFDIGSISRKLSGINARISVANSILFPCLNLLSSYQLKKRFVKILFLRSRCSWLFINISGANKSSILNS